MELAFKTIGLLLIALALVHITFPKYFRWKEELQSLSLINRQMMTIHTLFIAIVVFLMGLLCLTCSAELMGTPLGKKICWGLGVFWTIRLVIQFVGYSPELWRGKPFETFVHVLFSMLWTFLSAVFLWTAIAA